MAWILGIFLAMVGAIAVLFLSFTRDMKRTEAEIHGVGYYGRPVEERRAMKREIAARGRRYAPAWRLLHRLWQPRALLSIEHEGVTGPAATCSASRFAETAAFQPDERDVFVATQMKCGTTWMQQLAYEVILQGEGDFGDDAHRHLYSTSPWIESRHSVSLDDAPRLGDRGVRLIKTHMPTRLCPYSEDARYLYVTRHPVSCFSSTCDFVRKLAGPFAPTRDRLLDWYLSDAMWWRSWPEHVEGWWRWAQDRENVLFVHYEEMLADLEVVAERVSTFLDVPLAPDALASVVEKSGFEYMKANEECFEMTPPNLFSEVSGVAYLERGGRSREADGDEAEQARIRSFCQERLRDGTYPLARFYPDVAEPV